MARGVDERKGDTSDIFCLTGQDLLARGGPVQEYNINFM